MLKITNPRLGLSSPCPVASEIAYNGTQTGLPGNVQDAITQLDTNINIISNDYEIKEVFNDISGETSGTVETYDNIAIMQEEWANEDNAIAVELSEGKPTETFLFTSEGEIVKAIIDENGNYTLDGIPTATNYAICYLVKGTKSAFGNANIPANNIISEYDFDSPYVVNGTDIEPTNLNYNLNLKNGGLKDTNVSTAVNLGDSSNTSANTNNKTLLGAINELKQTISGGVLSPQPLYLTNDASSIVGSYKQLSYNMPSSQTIIDTIVNNNEVLINTYLFDLPVGITTINPGEWIMEMYSYVSQTTLLTKYKITVFARTAAGVETDLFTVSSNDINNLTVGEVNFETYQNELEINSTDYLGLRLYANTTASIDITVHTYIGDGNPSYLITPLTQRHDLLRGVNLAANGITYGHINDQAQTIAGVKTFSSFPITPSSAPTTDYQIANKKFVNDYSMPLAQNTSSSSIGYFYYLNVVNGQITLPSTGTWMVWGMARNGSGVIIAQWAGIYAGGSSVGNASYYNDGFALRIQ